MQALHTNPAARTQQAPVAPASDTAASVPLTGIERLMADALIALDRDASGSLSEPGAIEYASWLRMLRRTTP